MNFTEGYNDRLFNGWQSIYHFKRFFWLEKSLKKYGKKNASFIELGCFDAKTLDFIPKDQLGSYLGLDANWEKGLDIAKEKYKDNSKVSLRYCSKPDEISVGDVMYDIGVSLETLEHVPPEMMEGFLAKLASCIDGYFFVTVPVERGFSLLVATLIRAFNRTWEQYSLLEWCNAFFGRMNKVNRREHKGFDDRLFMKQVAKYFNIVETEGVFFRTPFNNLNLSIGIIAKSKK